MKTLQWQSRCSMRTDYGQTGRQTDVTKLRVAIPRTRQKMFVMPTCYTKLRAMNTSEESTIAPHNPSLCTKRVYGQIRTPAI